MKLKQIEIQGFKSFPDRICLSFQDGLTAVVGPNGSGKSNISDAVRWVLGEQSTKTLRGSKMEDIIFGGTKNRKASGFAEVSLVVFDGERGAEGMGFDGDTVTITRKYYRSGESEYKINGASVRLRDVYEYFMDTGLGRDGYSLIGQGKIAEIVSAKSTERREIFEEAAGIAKYRWRREEAVRKLKSAGENLERLRDILDELEARVGPLQKESEKARLYVDYAAEKKELEISLWVMSLQRLRNEQRVLTAEYMAGKERYDTLQGQIDSTDQSISEIYEKSQALSVRAEELRAEISELEENISRGAAQRASLESDIRHAEETIERLAKQTDEAAGAGNVLDEKIEIISLEKDEMSAKRDEMCRQQKEAESRLAEISDLSGSAAEEVEQLSAALSALEIEITDSRMAAISSTAAAENLRRRFTAIENDISARNRQLETLGEEEKNLKELLEGIEEKVAELDNQRNGLLSLQNLRREKLKEAEENRDAILYLAKEKQQRASVLSDMDKNLEGFQHSVKSVLKAAENGSLHGICGPVSKLVQVPKKFASAVETALGAAMQNIVVDNDSDAKQAIAFLKKNDGGRATFLPVSAIKASGLKEQGLEDHPGFMCIASEAVKCENKYLSIISSLLGRTVIAEDLNAAAVIAKKFGYRFRIVTLDGQLIGAGGSFTGGSIAKRASLLSRRDDIEALEKEAAALLKKAAESNSVISELESGLAAVEAELLGTESEIRTFSEDKIRFESEHFRISHSMKEASEALETHSSELQKTGKELSQHNNVISESEKSENRYAEKKSELTSAISEKSAVRGERDTQREEITQQIISLKFSVLEANKDIERLESEIEALKSKKLENQRLGLTAGTETEALREEIESKKQEILALEKTAAENTAAIEAHREEIKKLALRRESFEKEINSVRSGEREKSDEKERVFGELTKLQERTEAKKQEFDNLIARLFAEYGLSRAEAEGCAKPVPSVSAATKRLQELRGKIRALGPVNVGAIDEYSEVSQRFEFLSAQVQDAESSKRELEKLIAELTKEMSEIFIDNFHKIAAHFSEIFIELFGGGSAKLELSDPSDVLESGIDIFVEPPGKIIKNLSALSGGEQAFVAIAIYFAILKVRPAPFCILDEIEAALDDVNVTRYAQYLRRMCEGSQLIAITHRRGTMEEADVLYGVTMQEEGVSKLLKLQVHEAIAAVNNK